MLLFQMILLLAMAALFSGCTKSSCPDSATFTITPEGGTYTYCQWALKIPPGAVSSNTEIQLSRSSTVKVQNSIHMAFENPNTNELEPFQLDLDEAPGLETIELTVTDPGNISNPQAFGICPGTDSFVTVRYTESGTDQTATPLLESHHNDPCFEIFGNRTAVGEPVFLSGASTDWEDAWNRLLSNSSEIYQKYIQGYQVVDPCVLCSYGGFQLASYLVPSDCQNFTTNLICTAILPNVGSALPLALIPPLKQGICASAKAAISSSINYLGSKLSLPSTNTLCEFIDYQTTSLSGAPIVRDTLGCVFQNSCAQVTSCTTASLNSKWIADSVRKCVEIGF